MAASPRGNDPTRTLVLIAAVVAVIAVLGVGVAFVIGGDDEEPSEAVGRAGRLRSGTDGHVQRSEFAGGRAC